MTIKPMSFEMDKRQQEFVSAYVECIEWAEDIELSESDLQDAIIDAVYFHMKYSHLWDAIVDDQAGHDLWLTRNGHGAGFWDRTADVYPPENAQALTEAAEHFGPKHYLA